MLIQITDKLGQALFHKKIEKNTSYFLDARGVLVKQDIYPKKNGASSVKVTHRNNKLFISPENTLIKINGQVINKEYAINNGDWLYFSESVFRLLIDECHKKGAPPYSQNKTKYSQVVSIGRSEENDIEIPTPMASKFHAKLEQINGKYFLSDLSSTNGTFVNGKRIGSQAILQPGDRLDFSNFTLWFDGNQIIKENNYRRGAVLRTTNLSKAIQDKNDKSKTKILLETPDLIIPPQSFIVVFGTSGSGKSTLIDLLSGRRHPSTGTVKYDDIDLISEFDLCKNYIGYVPQQDIIHNRISIKAALHYTALLRLPMDIDTSEIDHRIDEILKQIDLTEKKETIIGTPQPLSGGQLKRVNLAVELIADPDVLFLDEPTSGLDSATDKRMMELFAKLAHNENKTVICVTHALENINLCDYLILVHKGQVIYYDAPENILRHFNCESINTVIEQLDQKPITVWCSQFEHPPMNQLFDSNHIYQSYKKPSKSLANSCSIDSFKFNIKQLSTLTLRNLDLLIADKKNLIIMLLQAPLISFIIGMIFSDNSNGIYQTNNQLLFTLIMSSIWMGCLNAVKEIVKEKNIYKRERFINLNLTPYTLSKLAPLSLISFVQSLILIGITNKITPIPGDFNDLLLILIATSLTAMSLGLAISALVESNESAISLATIILIIQVILSGGIIKLNGMMESIAEYLVLSYWALKSIQSASNNDEFHIYLIYLFCFFVLYMIITIISLKLKDKSN